MSKKTSLKAGEGEIFTKDEKDKQAAKSARKKAQEQAQKIVDNLNDILMESVPAKKNKI